MDVARLYAVIDANVSPFTSKLAVMEGRLLATQNRLQRFGSYMTLAVTTPLLALGKQVVQTATRFESLERGMTAVMHSSTAAKSEITKLQEVAKLPGLGFREAIQGSINLQAAGFSADQARKSLAGFGNALATVGKGKADLDGVTLALTQIASKGKVMGEEINQLSERVPQIRQIMLRVFGTADTEILQKAKLTSSDFVRLVTNELLKLPQVTGGAQNSFENLQDTMERTMGTIGKAILPTLTHAIDQLEPKIKQFADNFGRLPLPVQESYLKMVALVGLAGPASIAFSTMVAGVRGLQLAIMGLMTPIGIATAGLIALIALAAKTEFDIANVRGHVVQPSDMSTDPKALNSRITALRDNFSKLKKERDSYINARNFDPVPFMANPANNNRIGSLNERLGTTNKLLKDHEAQLKKVTAERAKLDASMKPDPGLDKIRKQIAAAGAPKVPKGRGGGGGGSDNSGQEIVSYLNGLERAYYDINNSGRVAEVMWERQAGVLVKASSAVYGHALSLAKEIDETEKLQRIGEKSAQLMDSLFMSMKLGANASESQRLKFRLMKGDLKDLAPEVKKVALEWSRLTEFGNAPKIPLLNLGADFDKAMKQFRADRIERVSSSVHDALESMGNSASFFFNAIHTTSSGLNTLENELNKLSAASSLRLTNPALSAETEFMQKFGEQLQQLKGKIPQADFDKLVGKMHTTYAQIKADDLAFAGARGFEEYLANTQKALTQGSAKNGLEQFKASLLQVKEIGGEVRLIQPYTETQLNQMYAAEKSLQRITRYNDTLKTAADGLRNIFIDTFESIGKGVQGIFDALLGGFRNLMMRMAAEWFASQMSRIIMNIAGWLGGVFGGAGGSGGSGNLLPSGVSANGPSFIPTSPFGRAAGGFAMGSRAYLVGERGPEMFVPSTAGRVEPLDGGSPNITIHVHGVTDADSFVRSHDQIVGRLTEAIQSRNRRNRRR